jgi:hypothetical protein
MTPAQVGTALESSGAMGELLGHMAKVARPGQGAPKILVPIARMASNECDWIEGGLTAEITPEPGKTVILVAVELGLGMRELLFPRLKLDVPYEEFERMLENAPQLVFPMKCKRTKKSIVLTCAEAVVGTLAPPSFASAEADVRSVLPAKLRRSLAPIEPDAPPTGAGGRNNRLEVDTGPVGEVAILARLAPKQLRTPKISELEALDVGWDVGAYSSTVSTRETKPPPPGARVPSTAPTRPPSAAAGAGGRKSSASSSKSSSRAPTAAGASSRKSKAPPAKTPAASAPAVGKGPPRPALRRTSKRPAKPKS